MSKVPVVPRRWYFVDNLRIFFALGVILPHIARPYISPTYSYIYPWFFYERDPSLLLAVGSFFLRTVNLNGFFLIAGFFAFRAIEKHSFSSYSFERAKRLLLPFFLFFPLVVPVSYYLGFLGAEKTGIRQALSRFFPGVSADTVTPTFSNVFSASVTTVPVYPIHLWFLPVLFLFSLLAAMAVWANFSFLKRLARSCFERMGLAKYVALAAITWAFTLWSSLGRLPTTETTFAWFSIRLSYLPMYAAYFLLGMAACRYNYLDAIKGKSPWMPLFAGFLFFAAFLETFLFHPVFPDMARFGSFQIHALYAFFEVFASFFLMLGFVLLAMRFFDVPSLWNKQYVKHYMTIYILHVPIAIFFQYLFVGVSLPVLVKFLIVAVLTLAVTGIGAAMAEGISSLVRNRS